MTRTRRWVSISLVAVAAIVIWAAEPGASAHDGHKRKNAPVSAKKLKNPFTANDGTVSIGRKLFTQHCAICHGEDGKSQTDVANAMKIKPTDLTGKEMHGITDGEIYWVITNGIKPNRMPAFKLKASNEERWQLTVYVKHLMGEHSHTGAKH
ncbi:MAG: c-type cytochrome [Blastocatellales bacterium]|nr:c-type cytochrome [Blastocatellales bacterium]